MVLHHGMIVLGVVGGSEDDFGFLQGMSMGWQKWGEDVCDVGLFWLTGIEYLCHVNLSSSRLRERHAVI